MFKLVIFFDKTYQYTYTVNVSCEHLHKMCSLNRKEFPHNVAFIIYIGEIG